MNIFDALILGILQGLTEFLPVSSSGHLVLGQRLLNIEIPGNVFEVVVHLGTLLSVLVVFKDDIIHLITDFSKRQTQKYLLFLIIGTIPAVLAGLFFKESINELFDSLGAVALALIFTGFMLSMTKWKVRTKREMTIGRSILIGMAQAFAMIPGISRSGATISTSLLLGIDQSQAARFSFLLAIPAIIGAGLITVLDIVEYGESLLSIPVMLTGLLSSFLVGWISLKWLLNLLRSGKFYWFGIYCFSIGLLAWVLK